MTERIEDRPVELHDGQIIYYEWTTDEQVVRVSIDLVALLQTLPDIEEFTTREVKDDGWL